MTRAAGLERWRGLRTTRHLGRRLLILYALTAAVVATVFSTALLTSWVDTATLLALMARRSTGHQAIARLQASERNGTTLLLEYLATGDPTTLARYRATLAERQDALNGLGDLPPDKADPNGMVTLRARFADVDRAAERAIAARQAGGTDAALADWRADGAPLVEALAVQIGAIDTAQDRTQRGELDSVRRNNGTLILLTIFSATAVALVGLWITRRVILSVTRPLESLARAAAAIGAGNLATRVAPGLSVEFDMLGGVMNTMAGQLAASRDELQHALAATERRNRELRLLGDVGAALDSSLDLAQIVDRCLDSVITAFGATAGAIVLFGESGETWRWRDTGSRTPEPAPGEVGEIVRAALVEPALEAGCALILPRGETLTLAIVPLEAAVRTHGVLALVASPGWTLDERDLALLEQIGRQIARAVENVQLYLAEKGRSAEAGMLAQMAQLTSGTLDLDRLARLIARYAVQVLGVDRCIIGFFDHQGEGRGEVDAGPTLQRLYQYGFQTQQESPSEDEREQLQALVAQYMGNGQTLIVSDAQLDLRPEVGDLAARLRARSFIGVPLIARERQVGLIYLDTREPRQHSFGPQDQRILTAIADQAAAAIDAARLYEAERRRGAQLRVLNETGQQIAAAAQLDELFARVTTTIRDTFGYQLVRIGLIDGDELAFVASAGAGVPAEEQRLALDDEHPATLVARLGRPEVVVESTGWREQRVGLIVPLRTKESVIGVLEVAGSDDGRASAFDEDDERTLGSLGDQLGTAVEKSRLQERALGLAVVEERNRLARELHDSVTQALFSISLTIEAARLLLRRDLDATERHLAGLGERTQEALTEMRALIHSLRPAGLEDQGLIPALTRQAERVRREHLLPVEVTVEGRHWLRLDEEQERELFRIAQEALNNVVKHASATRASLRLRATQEAFTLVIEDNGKGFDPAAPPRRDAFGVLGMRERVLLLHGTIAIDTAPGEGTRVVVTVPRPGYETTERRPAGRFEAIAVTGGG